MAGFSTIQHYLIHLPDQSIDFVFAVAQVTSLDIVLELPGPESTRGTAQLEWPKEVARLLEVGSDGVYLMDQILHAKDAIFAQVLLNDGIVTQRNSLWKAVVAGPDLAVSTLVDEFAYALQVWVSVGDERLNNPQHFNSRFGESDEYARIDVKESEELQGLALLWVDFIDTIDWKLE